MFQAYRGGGGLLMGGGLNIFSSQKEGGLIREGDYLR